MTRPISPLAIPRYLIVQLAFGIGLGFFVGLTILIFDVAGLESLITSSGDPIASFVIVVSASVAIFPALVLATAIGALRDDD